MIINFRLLSGQRFQLDIDPSISIGHIICAFEKNNIIKGRPIRILLRGKYLREIDLIGNLEIGPRDFLLCHAGINYKRCMQRHLNQNQTNEERNDDENDENGENTRNALTEMGISFQDAIIALGIADGSPERAAQILYNYRRIQQQVDSTVSEILQNDRITQYIEEHSQVPVVRHDDESEQNGGNQNSQNQSNAHTDNDEQESGDNQQTVQQEDSQGQRYVSQSTQHQSVFSQPPQQEEQQTEENNDLDISPPSASFSTSISTSISHSPFSSYSSDTHGRIPLQIQQTLAVQRTPIEDHPPENHMPEDLPQNEENDETEAENSEESAGRETPLIRTIRDSPDRFPSVVDLVQALDPEFALRIREDPEEFLRKCNLQPENYNCEVVRFIPPEFRYLNASIRKSMKNILKKSHQQGLRDVIKLLNESGHGLVLPIKKNPEGFLHALGLNPSEFNCDEVRLSGSLKVSDVFANLSDGEKVELIHLTNVGFGVSAVMEAFERCNHDPEAARNLLMNS